LLRGDLDQNILDDTDREEYAGRALPLYNCVPNLDGGAATPLTAAQTKVFEHFILTARDPDSYKYPPGS